MLVIAWILLYFSIGIGLTTLWQVTVAGPGAKNDEACVIFAVIVWPIFLTGVGMYHIVVYLTRYFEAKYRNH